MSLALNQMQENISETISHEANRIINAINCSADTFLSETKIKSLSIANRYVAGEIKLQMLSNIQFYKMLENADWWHSFSDDYRVRNKGAKEVFEIRELASQYKELYEMYVNYKVYTYTDRKESKPELPIQEKQYLVWHHKE